MYFDVRVALMINLIREVQHLCLNITSQNRVPMNFYQYKTVNRKPGTSFKSFMLFYPQRRGSNFVCHKSKAQRASKSFKSKESPSLSFAAAASNRTG